jgi:hypothetical protein
MAWSLAPNAHIKLWTAAPLPGGGAPVGLPQYDGAAQLLVPLMSGGGTSPWRGRCVVPTAGVQSIADDIQAVATCVRLYVIDDTTALSYGPYQVIDQSPDSGPSGLPMDYTVAVTFLAYQLIHD